MPNYTENYNLKKPLQEEFYNIDDHNGNMDIIDAELKKRALLDEDGKVPSEQLPSMDYIPANAKGNANGVATLDATGKVPSSQLPEGGGGGSGKRTARFTVGSSQYGWTASDCDYLCDGTADEVEINAAIQALRSTGGEIVLLDGLYNLTSAILINKDGVTLSGNGSNTKLIRAFNDDEYDEALQGLIIITNSFCTIKNLYIDDVKGNYTSYRTINLYSGTNCIIANNTLISVGGDGIFVDSDNHTIDNNSITNCGNSGIYLYKCNKSIVTNNKVTGSATYGIYASRIGDAAINNNICTGNSNSGIYLYWADRTVVTGNVSNSNGHSGLYLSRGSGNIICGNAFIGNSSYGVYFYSTVSYCTVMSNSFNNNTSGNVKDDGTDNIIHLPDHSHSLESLGAAASEHEHDGADITSGFDVLAANLGVARIASGNYIGTGTWDSTGSKPSQTACSLTFDFDPQVVIITHANSGSTAYGMHAIFFIYGLTSSYKSWGYTLIDKYNSSVANAYVLKDSETSAKYSNKTLSWYYCDTGSNENYNLEGHMNVDGRAYKWTAIG